MGLVARRLANLFEHNPLLQHGLKFVINNKDFIDVFVLCEANNHIPCDFQSFRKFDTAFAGKPMYSPVTVRQTAKEVSSLAANCQEIDLLPGFSLMKACAAFMQVRIEGAAQSFIGSNQNQQVAFIAPQIEKRMMEIFVRATRQIRPAPRSSCWQTAAQ